MGTWRVIRPASRQIGMGKGLGSEFVVVPVCVDGAEQDRVLQDHVAVEEPGIDLDSAPAADTPVRQMILCRTCCGPTSSSICTKPVHSMTTSASAAALAQVAAVDVGCPEPADHLWLAPFGDQVEHVSVVATLTDSRAASSPMGPAPVMSTFAGDQVDLRPIFSMWSRPWPRR